MLLALIKRDRLNRINLTYKKTSTDMIQLCTYTKASRLDDDKRNAYWSQDVLYIKYSPPYYRVIQAAAETSQASNA